ncbi:MAG: ABC transporter permease [Flavobacteriales bacterium]|nr:ABC transporter permease [Flavobacteriales bacterium]
MFDRDLWGEIWNTLSRNKLRTFLTAFGVGWGIFMLVIMLGAGNGLANGAKKGFAGWATNSAFIWTQPTSIPYHGFSRGRRFYFNNDDIGAIIREIPEVEYLAPRNQLGGWQGGNNVVRNNKTGAFSVYGDMPVVMKIQSSAVDTGRFLNDKDVADQRKVCVIGKRVREVLFEPHEDPIGEYIRINGVFFQVVGMHRSIRSSDNAEEDESTIYVPFTTFQNAFNYHNFVSWFSVTAREGTPVSEVEEGIKKLMARRHDVDPNDPMAFGSFNLEEQFDKMNQLLIGINLLSWIVGILTLLAGVIGISNIMLVIIKERTKEIGVRRAIGATPRIIRRQIVLESVSLTLLAGYTGLTLGVGLLELLILAGMEGDFFHRPEVDLRTALIALSVLIVSGLFAGLIPASRALRINAVDALRAE